MGIGSVRGYVEAMVNDRRNRTRDGFYFFSIVLRDRRSDLLVQRIDPLFQAWRGARRRHRLIAVVVMPDQLHAVVRMTDGRDDYFRLVQDIKKGFTRRIASQDGSVSPWQPRFRNTPFVMPATCVTTSTTSPSIR